MGLSSPTTPQRQKIQSRPVQLETQERKIDIGTSSTDVDNNDLLMKRKGKKQTRASLPSNSGLNMGG